ATSDALASCLCRQGVRRRPAARECEPDRWRLRVGRRLSRLCGCGNASLSSQCDRRHPAVPVPAGRHGDKCDRCLPVTMATDLTGAQSAPAAIGANFAPACDNVTGQCQCVDGVRASCDIWPARLAEHPQQGGCKVCDSCIFMLNRQHRLRQLQSGSGCGPARPRAQRQRAGAAAGGGSTQSCSSSMPKPPPSPAKEIATRASGPVQEKLDDELMKRQEAEDA
uniref:Stc1 domain-containing protein n=1 Tax=Macrostomum lignano TaxID=282301 RepID=A0A1I8FRY4_9PLAT